MHTLFTAATANGNSTVRSGIDFRATAQKTIYAWGTWNGATLSIETSPDNVNWFPAKNYAGTALAFTANGSDGLAIESDYIRAVITNAGGSTSLSAAIG